MPDLDKLLAGELPAPAQSGEFCTADIMEQTGLTESAARRKIRQAMRRGLVEFVGNRPRQSIDRVWRKVPHYRVVESK